MWLERIRVVGFVVALLVSTQVWAQSPTPTTTETPTVTPTPLVCLVTTTADSGAGSLRQAITDANASSCTVINFAIGGCPCTIVLASSLPVLFAPNILIDGTSESGTNCAGHVWQVIVDANGNTGFRLAGGGATLQGLEIINATVSPGGTGVDIGSSNNLVRCNYVHACRNGIAVTGLWNANVIGGSSAGDGNVSGNNTGDGINLFGGGNSPTNTIIQGNILGFLPDGVTAAGNEDNISLEGAAIGTIIGGTTVGARNVIGNGRHQGINLHADGSDSPSGTLIQGNYIGVDQTGNVAAPNLNNGILVVGTGNIIGGSTTNKRNTISANVAIGVEVDVGSISTTIENNYVGIAADGQSDLCNGNQQIFNSGIGTTLTNNALGCQAGIGCCAITCLMSGICDSFTCLSPTFTGGPPYTTTIERCQAFIDGTPGLGVGSATALSVNVIDGCSSDSPLGFCPTPVATCIAGPTQTPTWTRVPSPTRIQFPTRKQTPTATPTP